ncbi:heavy metal efflux pump, CzcA family [Thermocrinis albus DSM 14484]|uniref:Heavy metal efflux pump, CzcA family n=1 Tax=Thermocrinis albus (strain DSM 14484 / JCM 11386 / HI 11/12) TaxID=638303 RepID=D3SQH1_THEAH|nr:CusA/CzcA family heavy metal efflux RND transporter [Thermocrinis albus]ADC89408.1 heavy metal efflux pump, CzcA family [Thermocrinis albus DSM 14484]
MRKILEYRLLVIIALFVSVGVAVYSILRIPIEAFPDPTPVQVTVYTETPGMSAEETEVLVTRVVETNLMGLKNAELVRSVTLPGLSYVTVYFKEGTDIQLARNLVAQRIPVIQSQIPPGLTPRMGPNTSGLGNVMFYALVDTEGNHSLEDLRLLQEYRVRPIIMSVPGVEEISQWGPEKAYLVKLLPERMTLFQVDITDVIRSLEEYNQVAGGGFLVTPQGDLVVRGLGRLKSVEEIRKVPIYKKDGSFVTLGDIALVEEGEVPNRRGAFTLNGEEVQGNIVLKRVHTNTVKLLTELEKAVKQAQSVLPEGVKLEVLYQQGYLIEKAIKMIVKALVEGVILVALAITIYMWNPRTALLVSLSIPLTLLYALTVMYFTGVTANLMTLGGLAIGLGLFADASVVVVENIYRHLSEKGSRKNIFTTVLVASQEMFRPVFFAILTIAVVFLPIFTFESVEGKYYKPLALSVIFALISSLVVAFVFMPVLSFYFLKPGREHSPVLDRAEIIYMKLFEKAMQHRKLVIAAAGIAFVMALLLQARIGREFAPPLEEGALLVKSFLNPNVSLQEAKRVASLVETTALKLPEVERAYSNIGRADVGDPEDVSYMETFIILKDTKARARVEEKLREELKKIPGVEFSYTQPIQMRIDELLSGVKAPVAIKVFGDDLWKINQLAGQIQKIVESTPGAVDAETEAQAGKLQMRIEPRWDVLQRYDITTADIMKIVAHVLGGQYIGYVQKDTLLFPIVLTVEPKDVTTIQNLPIFLKDGTTLLLKDIANITVTEGFLKIRRENGMRYALVLSDVKGRDLGSFVQELQARIQKEVKLPEGYRIVFAGQWENQQRAMKKLSVAVPLAIALIFILLYLNFGSVRYSLIVMLNVPFATIGGVVALYLSGFNLSVPAAIGFIAVFGIATLNGVVLVSYVKNLLEEEKLSLEEAIRRACRLRLRPILITATAASLGLVPMLLSTDVGSEVQKPLAVVVLGGIFTSTSLTLLVLPSVLSYFAPKTRV